MSLISDLVSKATAIITWQPGTPGFGATLLGFYGSVRDTVVALYDLVLTKAPGDHTHEGAGSTPILSRGGEGDRLADGVSLHLRTDDPGRAEVVEDGALVATLTSDRAPRALGSLLEDELIPAEFDASLGAVRFANGGAAAWGHFEAWLGGVGWRIRLEAMMSTASTNQFSLGLWYQAFGPGTVANPVKRRWQPSTVYSAGATRIPTINVVATGYYYTASAGTSGATEPTWPTTIGATVADGTVTWTCTGEGMQLLSVTATPPAAAYARFDLDLVIPAVAVGDRVHFGLVRSPYDNHSGDLLVTELWVAPVEV